MDKKTMTYPLNIRNTYYIVDDFYTDVNAIREYAISLPRERESKGNYAGYQTEKSFLTQEHLDSIGYLVGHKVAAATPFTGTFRFTSMGDKGKQDIHFDPGQNDCVWAGVVYLSPDHPTDLDGTIFWRHNRTGLDAIPLTLSELKPFGNLENFLNTEGMEHSFWTKTMAIPFKYNRLVLFRPWMFHSPGPSFGHDYRNNRLIQTFFFRQDV